MATPATRLLMLLLAIGLCPAAHGFAQEKERPKPTPFENAALLFAESSFMLLMQMGYFPHLTSFPKMPGDDFGPDMQKQIKTFPEDLIEVLGNQKSAEHETAVFCVGYYAGVARAHAALFGEKELAPAVGRALAPYTCKIQERLEASLQSEKIKTRLWAALTLCFMDEKHAKANEAMKAIAAAGDPKVLEEACPFIGVARLASPQTIELLGRALKHQDEYVRHEAAGAAITMGPFARDLAPALIAFLDSGEKAEGSYSDDLVFGSHEKGNLALMALEALKEHAKPAIPAILARFPKASDANQIAMLACLASAGGKEDACLALVRESMKSKKLDLKLAAACTLLHLASGDRDATELLKKALANEATKEQAIEICQKINPPSREIAACFLPMLESTEEEERITATKTLAGIGPEAVEAVPRLEKLLAKEDDGMTHTYHSTQAAAYALWKIGGKEAAAALWRVADSDASGARYAIVHVGKMGDDLAPNTVEVLVRMLKGKNFSAGVALSNLGERARPVRPEMERLIDDPTVGWIVDSALRRIPAK